ncbi:MAG TPA: thioredoxin family protein [Phycisphaerales bacterium]|nr:thioredoxin family protein [Phycisphaerales bacterium]
MKIATLAALMVVAGTVASPTITLAAQPQVQPAPAKAKPALYDVNADAKQQIAAAVAKAKKENRRVLIQWGGNWCTWCIKLDEAMKADPAIARTLKYEYDVVHIDAGQPKDKNLDLASGYGADLKGNGFPFLTILDADGKPVVNQETASLEKKNASGESLLGKEMGHDTAKVLKFLKDHAAKPLEAQKVVDAGIAQAKSSGKLVFLHFGAPWCGWCHRLEDWMAKPEPAALLSKAFVDVKVDEDRMTGGKDLLAKYRGSAKGGIPWFAFLDGDGKVVATSDAPGSGNVGFPAAKEEIAHFSVMLKTAGKLTDDERAKLVESLKSDKAPARGGAH